MIRKLVRLEFGIFTNPSNSIFYKFINIQAELNGYWQRQKLDNIVDPKLLSNKKQSAISD